MAFLLSENCNPNVALSSDQIRSPASDLNKSVPSFLTPRSCNSSSRYSSTDAPNPPVAPATIPLRKLAKGMDLALTQAPAPVEDDPDESGRKPCGTRVQSLVQAFESMICLSESGVQSRRCQGCAAGCPDSEEKGQIQSVVRKIEAAIRSHALEGEAAAKAAPSKPSCKILPLLDSTDGSEGYQSDGTTSYESQERAETSGCGPFEFRSSRGAPTRRARVTCLQPFTLRTQERGAKREHELRKKLDKMLEEDRRMKIPVAQGLPWTTDVPEIVPKPPVKESTVPVDIRLCTQYRSIERAEFDHYMAAKLMYLEQQRQEQQRLRELAEEEEIKRLRKEMVPRAQLMPYFDRPFVPRRSAKPLTVPKEPHFQVKCNSSARIGG